MLGRRSIINHTLAMRKLSGETVPIPLLHPDWTQGTCRVRGERLRVASAPCCRPRAGTVRDPGGAEKAQPRREAAVQPGIYDFSFPVAASLFSITGKAARRKLAWTRSSI